MKKCVNLLLVIVMLLFVGCSHMEYKPTTLPEYKVEKMEPYVYDESKDPRPIPLNPIFLDENFVQCNKEDAKYLAFSNKEFAKIRYLKEIAKYYKDQNSNHVILINDYIRIINLHNEYIKLEEQKSMQYKRLWEDSEKAYQKEKFYHGIDNWINRGINFILGGGLLYVITIL